MSLKEKQEEKSSAKTTSIGTDKICPVNCNTFYHCLDSCEWNDGEGCAVWRIVKNLERGNYWLELLVKERDSK